MAPHTNARLLTLPTSVFSSADAVRTIVGASGEATTRLLIAYLPMLYETGEPLDEAGTQTTYNATNSSWPRA